jgi:hypothetical protein
VIGDWEAMIPEHPKMVWSALPQVYYGGRRAGQGGLGR